MQMPRARCNASPSPKEQQGKGFLSLFPPNPCFPLSGTPALGLEHPSRSTLLAQGEEAAGRADLKLPKSRRKQGDATRTPKPSSYSPSPGFSTARKPQGVLAGTKVVSSWRNTWHGPSAEAGHGDMDRLPSAPPKKGKAKLRPNQLLQNPSLTAHLSQILLLCPCTEPGRLQKHSRSQTLPVPGKCLPPGLLSTKATRAGHRPSKLKCSKK